MANTFTGIQKAVKELQLLKEQSRRAMRKGEKKIADLMAAEAQVNVPVRMGIIRNNIGVEQSETSTTVYAGPNEIAAYQEFGTGPLVSVPAGLEAYAKEFFVNGKGNTPPAPYFFPAIFKYRDRLIPAVEEELKKIGQ